MTENMRLRPRGHWTMTDEQYRETWLTRVRAYTEINESGCWLWRGTVNHKGYGITYYRGRGQNCVHRLMYMVTHGVELAREQFVCHTCDTPRCVNPVHLWVGTTTDNQRDRKAKGRNFFANKTHCKRGHPFSPDNTRMSPFVDRNGTLVNRRVCIACEKLRSQWPHYMERNRAYQRERKRRLRAERFAKQAESRT